MTTGVVLLKEGVVKGDNYVYDLFLIVFVQCIDIYADHCTDKEMRNLNYLAIKSFIFLGFLRVEYVLFV